MQPIKTLDYFFILRPIVFFPGWTTGLAAYVLSGNEPSLSWIPPYPLLWLALASGMLLGCGFIINQLADTETDRLNKKLFFLSGGFIPHHHAKIEAVILGLCGLVITWMISNLLLAITLAFMIIIPAYSIPPFRLKDHAFRSLAANASMGAAAFIYGWFVRGSGYGVFVAILPYLGYNTAMCLLTTIPDISGDRETGKTTLAVRYGVRNTMTTALCLVAFSGVAALLLHDWMGIVINGFTLPLFALAAWKNSASLGVISLKLSLFLFALVVSYYFPWYLIVIALFYVVTRVYYKRRFNMIYPSFGAQ